jgi:hypothetical protein
MLFIAGCAQKYPGMLREHRFHDTRRWKFDLAWPDKKIACEIEGANWVKGRHNHGEGFEGDCEKYSVAAILGWKVVRVTYGMIRSGLAFDLIDGVHRD